MTNIIPINPHIRPASGDYLKHLQIMLEDARVLVDCLALEISGVRDGDGYWCGCDVIGNITRDLVEQLEITRGGEA